MIFRDILIAANQVNCSFLAVGLAPSLSRMPLEFQRYDDPFLPFGKAVIDATRDQTCGYVFHLAAYLALGAAGAVALERTIAYVPSPLIKILHGPFASPDYAAAAFEDALNVDAVTIAPTTDVDLISPFVAESHHGVFIHRPKIFRDDLNDLLFRLSSTYRGQIGIYVDNEAGFREAVIPPGSRGNICWYWNDLIYPSPADDFRTGLHATAARLRKEMMSGYDC